jgi:hypothetical protein
MSGNVPDEDVNCSCQRSNDGAKCCSRMRYWPEPNCCLVDTIDWKNMADAVFISRVSSVHSRIDVDKFASISWADCVEATAIFSGSSEEQPIFTAICVT